MLSSSSTVPRLATVVAGCLLIGGCCVPLPWPESPLYETPTNDPNWVAPASKEEAMAAMAGHYAHYDIVAYEGVPSVKIGREFLLKRHSEQGHDRPRR